MNIDMCPDYWNREISLKITDLLIAEAKARDVHFITLETSLYEINSFGFAPDNINAVKDAYLPFFFQRRNILWKNRKRTVNGQDVNGWFIGFIETADNTYFFATNIGADSDAAGSNGNNYVYLV